MGPKPVFIADGHHRYETGVKYLEEEREAGEVHNDEAPQNFTLMMLVGMSDPGLIILPTHRLVSGLGAISSAALKAALKDHFDIVGEFGADSAACWEHIQMDGSQSLLGFGTVADSQWFVAKLQPAALELFAPTHSAEWRSLGVSILHEFVMKQLLAKKGEPSFKFVHLLKEVTEGIAAKMCDMAVLVPPVAMSHVERIAGNLEKMPPKSTYFYPKILTGMVFNSLKKD
jgi:uncharacterized protein (DUF1015 family)